MEWLIDTPASKLTRTVVIDEDDLMDLLILSQPDPFSDEDAVKKYLELNGKFMTLIIGRLTEASDAT